ncbi:MAG: hypothetical protein A2W61_01005 [Deltaproteobacteria bacterium RIFCSPLOWO2_01_44_7]|nr:MAG: hypothetical protein A2712_05195 [Deltaproteobacteria bacterium RIFCSPHIGHO2_01_FULL_43_49]OGQ14400.1 MAG: hypothetical protein A3D22_05190 [Deltaproteobacteria bacterium RIFCSPHIGHO2_02_FULL_44_53]OGQ27560.1 MAG: hypothetical protein A3D98_08985 [Deltaproteobacteria bacterium RIFCSPHIGHO2_12_FULL_44_21]OGQ30841.1 MAG: hypothetical protein A2979_01600 [Deltaproteobacteria bacterium RIFCSPLOWO2_01_FULL_45_74]OGQ38492.1 MAG: hypothetical protein A2W61_01005 [Deltaproteobacteria bacterium 
MTTKSHVKSGVARPALSRKGGEVPGSNPPTPTVSTQTFSISEAIQFGWQITKRNFWFFIGLFIAVFAIMMAPAILAVLIQERLPFLSIIFNLGSWVLQVAFQMGMINITLKFCSEAQPRFSDLFYFSNFLSYFLASLLFALIVLGGMFLLIIPGIIWAIQFQFFSYAIVDKNLGCIDALKKSSTLTKGHKWKLCLFSLMCILLNFLGMLALIVGLSLTIPITMMATAHVYRKLESFLTAT